AGLALAFDLLLEAILEAVLEAILDGILEATLGPALEAIFGLRSLRPRALFSTALARRAGFAPRAFPGFLAFVLEAGLTRVLTRFLAARWTALASLRGLLRLHAAILVSVSPWRRERLVGARGRGRGRLVMS